MFHLWVCRSSMGYTSIQWRSIFWLSTPDQKELPRINPKIRPLTSLLFSQRLFCICSHFPSGRMMLIGNGMVIKVVSGCWKYNGQKCRFHFKLSRKAAKMTHDINILILGSLTNLLHNDGLKNFKAMIRRSLEEDERSSWLSNVDNNDMKGLIETNPCTTI